MTHKEVRGGNKRRGGKGEVGSGEERLLEGRRRPQH